MNTSTLKKFPAEFNGHINYPLLRSLTGGDNSIPIGLKDPGGDRYSHSESNIELQTQNHQSVKPWYTNLQRILVLTQYQKLLCTLQFCTDILVWFATFIESVTLTLSLKMYISCAIIPQKLYCLSEYQYLWDFFDEYISFSKTLKKNSKK